MATLRMERDSASVAIMGSGGAGAMTAGALLLEAAGRAGWYGLMTRSVGPQIRGGEAASFVRVATHPVDCMADRFDAVIAIDWQRADRFSDEIALDGASLLVGDPQGGAIPAAFAASGAKLLTVALKDATKVIEGGRPNMIALGLAAGLLGLPLSALFEVIEKRFGGKGEAALRANRQSVEYGLAEAARSPVALALARGNDANGGTVRRWLLTGNEATGLGAVRGGVRFSAAYPITPATEVLEWMTPALAKIGGVLVQAEDELASINMIIGSSFGGAPSLTATSGPGLALMSEAIGLAAAAEVPIVIVDVMRAGPSTGIPTRFEQSDLDIAVHGCHGDAPRVVVAPNSVADCVTTTQWAVHLAEAMQTPTLVLSDQFLGQTQVILDPPAPVPLRAARRLAEPDPTNPYRRYALTADGVSPMSIPGQPGGQYTADGLAHNERGTPSTKASDHMRQLDKRLRKVSDFDYGSRWAEIIGDGDQVILTWGSLTAAACEAARRLGAQGISTRVVSLRLIAPLQVAALEQALGDRRVLIVEQSHSGQLHRYLRSMCDLPRQVRTLHRPGPYPIGAREICSVIEAWGA